VLSFVAAMAAVLATISWSSRSSRDSVHTYRVWHWNIAGNAMHHGSTTDGLVKAAINSIRNRNADFVSLNEVCYSQFKALQKGLADQNWPQHAADFARFASTRSASPEICGGTGDYGIALFSRYSLGTSRQYALPSDGTPEQRKMLCAPLRDTPRMKFCTVHITTSNVVHDGAPDNYRQIEFVRRTLDAFDRSGQAYLIAGDFNAQPHYARLDQMYAPSATTANNPGNAGNHRELDDADNAHCPGYGEWTALGSSAVPSPCGGRAKVDQIFVRESRRAGEYDAVSLAIPTSCTGVTRCADHRVLVGTVRMRTP